MPKPRPAQIFAAALNVCCPYCGEPQPNGIGSEVWLAEEIELAQGHQPNRECVSCDKPFTIHTRSKAQV